MVAQATLLLFGSFFVMLLAGVPISAGIGIASIFTALFSMDPAIFALTAAQRCFSGIDSFSLLALPFFSLGGNIMNKGGIAKRLVRLARLAVGKMPGYLAATNVLANMFFTPIFLPITRSIGMSDVQFGIMLIMNLGIGSVTPPVGSCLFVGCGVGKVKIEGVTKYIVPLFASMVVALFLVTFIPAISLVVPYLCGLVPGLGWTM